MARLILNRLGMLVIGMAMLAAAALVVTSRILLLRVDPALEFAANVQHA